MRFVTWHTTVVALVILAVVLTLALLGFPEAAVAAATLGAVSGVVVQVNFHPRR